MDLLKPKNYSSLSILEVLKATADLKRLEILRCLGLGSFGVQEMSSIFCVAQPAMSHHLKLLLSASLVETRREGNFVFYSRRSPLKGDAYHELVKALFRDIDKLDLSIDISRRIDKIYESRSQQSLGFFEKHSAEFKEKQKLIAELDQYGQPLLSLVDRLPHEWQTVLEVGPGEGDFLKLLAKRFGQVWALDNSKEMLGHARKTVADERIKNVQFIEGNISDVSSLGEMKVDFVVFNMVLHHLASPEKAFGAVHGLLKAGGGFLVAELCAHHQSWVRETCGDLWLGFTPEELSAWAVSFGFREGPKSFLGLKNGFQIQLRLFFI